ncbi:MAG: sigma 54-interacting transcriptional regulator [Deltaproteobacteria bacterium]|nr:sigma 54-interacting transcriptional regulator [Deltaproteobacteria bacterium]
MSNTEFKTKNGMVNLYDAIINSSYDGLWICDYEGKVIRINSASEHINDIRAEQVLGKKMEDVVKEGLIDRSVTLEVLKARTAITIIQKLKNGKHILVTGNPFFDDRGDISLVVVNERDITELDSLRNELEESRALARRYRSELSQIMSKKDLLSQIVIRNEAMEQTFDRAMKVSQVDSTVLIQGESGVGKGLFARLIHRASKRKDGPFIRVDCGAIPESLIESELFGYEDGAFTGARAKGKPGHFEIAEGGTLFLDEIGDLPLNVQVKLLRFLEGNEVVRVGGTTARKINTRVISASNQDLEEMVAQGKFRKDFFFRLNVIPLSIPPLRERTDEIPALLNFFLKQCNEKCSADKSILPRAVNRLCRYSFPGNIRELANLVEQLVVLTPEKQIDLKDLPSHILRSESKANPRLSRDEWDLPKSVARLEREMISRALKVYGSQRRAAVPLNIDQSTLARKAKRYGIRNDAIVHHND